MFHRKFFINTSFVLLLWHSTCFTSIFLIVTFFDNIFIFFLFFIRILWILQNLIIQNKVFIFFQTFNRIFLFDWKTIIIKFFLRIKSKHIFIVFIKIYLIIIYNLIFINCFLEGKLFFCLSFAVLTIKFIFLLVFSLLILLIKLMNFYIRINRTVSVFTHSKSTRLK